MTKELRLTAIVDAIPSEWREDFCILLEGDDPSDAFLVYFDRDLRCRELFDAALWTLDSCLQARFAFVDREPSRN